MNDKEPIDRTSRTLTALLEERGALTCALAEVNAEMEKRRAQLEAAIGKPKRTRSDKGTTRKPAAGAEKAAAK